MFAFKLGYVLRILEQYVKKTDFKEIQRKYGDLPKISFDYEVVEKAASVAVLPYRGAWKDLGTWNTLTEEMEDFASGRTVGIETCNNTHVINELGLPIVTLGLNDLVVVATPDGILVTEKVQSNKMKPYVEAVASDRPMYEQRRWGEYRVVDSSVFPDGAKALTKELIVKAGQQTSYQRHECRSEFWTIVSGFGEVALDGLAREVRAGSAISIPAGSKHAIRAIEDLHLIEVQIGDVLIEEDIERFGDYWKQPNN